MVDVPQSILTLLSTNWTSGNTDSLTPAFKKITDAKRHDYNDNQDLVSAQRPLAIQKPAGIGQDAKQVDVTVNIDVRVLGSDQEDHFINVTDEITRILDNNLVSPFSGFDELSPDNVNYQDLSDARTHLWRIIIPVKVINHNKAR